MVDARVPVSELRIRTAVADDAAVTIILIDGVDVLELCRRGHDHSDDGDPDGSADFLPAGPVGLLPPDSAALLPTTAPQHAMIGVCTCGEPGCSSLWLQVRRDGGEVVWEPDPDTPAHGRSVRASWRFELRQYLDAVDDGARSITVWETRPVRVARELRRRRDGLDGFILFDSITAEPLRLLDARAWPGEDRVVIDVVGADAPIQLHVNTGDARTDQQVVEQLRRVDVVRDAAAEDDPQRGGAAAAASVARRSTPQIVVGSKNFAEQFVLGELYAQALRARSFDVALRANIGASDVLVEALDDGWIDMYPEYTGVIYAELAGLDGRPRTAAQAYDAAQDWERSQGNTMLAPSAFHTRGCVVVRSAFAREHGLATIADLGGLDHLIYAGTPELACADALRRDYGLGGFTFRPLDYGTGYAELAARRVDAIAALSSDGELAGGDYRVLADPEAVFGFGQVAPVVTQGLLAAMSPVFAATLDEVTGLLDQETIIEFNRAVELEQQDPRSVAETFLSDHGLVA